MTKINYKHYEFHFERILFEPQCQQLFYKHCKAELNLELLLFLVEVTKYNKLLSENTTISQKTVDMANDIKVTFIVPKSKQEINIPATVRNETLKRLETAQYDVAFELAYSTVIQVLQYDVFSRFKRSKRWIQFVESCSEKYLLTISTHISDIESMTIVKNDLIRQEITKRDIDLALHFMKDYYHWEPLYTSIKKAVTTYYTKKNFMEQEAIDMVNFMLPMKTVMNLKCSARFAVQLFASKEYFHMVYNHLLEPLDYIPSNDNSDHFPTSIVRQVFLPGGLVKPRHQSCSMSVIYLPDRKTYLHISKSCETDKMPIVESYYRAHQYVVVSFEETSADECRYSCLSMNSLKGWLKNSGSLNNISSLLFKTMAVAFSKDLRKRLLSAVEKGQMEQDVSLPDEAKIFQTIKDQESRSQI